MDAPSIEVIEILNSGQIKKPIKILKINDGLRRFRVQENSQYRVMINGKEVSQSDQIGAELKGDVVALSTPDGEVFLELEGFATTPNATLLDPNQALSFADPNMVYSNGSWYNNIATDMLKNSGSTLDKPESTQPDKVDSEQPQSQSQTPQPTAPATPPPSFLSMLGMGAVATAAVVKAVSKRDEPESAARVIPGPSVNTVAGDDVISVQEMGSLMSGTAQPYSTVTLTIGNTIQHVLTADANGAWQYALVREDILALYYGSSTVQVTAPNSAGQVVTTVHTIHIDTTVDLNYADVLGQQIVGSNAGELMGTSVSVGDINGDGLDDVMIGASGASGDAGRTYIIFGSATPGVINLSNLGTQGFVVQGHCASDASGDAVSFIGDVNGDGLGDFLIGAPGSDPAAGANAGRSYVIFGRAGSAGNINLAALDAGGSTLGFVINGPAAFAGNGDVVSAAGDVNGDGLADILIGTPNNPLSGAAGAGTSYVVFGKTGAQDVNLSAVANGVGGFKVEGHAAGDQSGFSLSAAGDVNGDGLGDFIVGAPYVDGANGTDAGRSYVVFGKTSGSAVQLSALGSGGIILEGQAANDRSGYTVHAAGDVNGDGLADLLVGAPLSAAGTAATNVGRSYVVFGQTNAGTLDLQNLGAHGYTIVGAAGADMAGYALSAAGDVNGDGLSDTIVTALGANSNGGQSYVVYGQSASNVTIYLSALGQQGFAIEGQMSGDYSGYSVSGAGDIDGDGLSDLVITAPSHDASGSLTDTGGAYILLSSQIMGANFGAQLTQVGTSSAETMSGTSGNDRIAAGAGDDVVIAAGGIDVLYGGAGNDTFILNISNINNLQASVIKGCSDFDTLKLDSSVTGVTLDLSSTHSALSQIEMIDMTDGGGNTVTLRLADVLALHDAGDTHSFFIRGESNDAVNLVDTGSGAWSYQSSQIVGGVNYDIYTNTQSHIEAIYIQQQINTNIV